MKDFYSKFDKAYAKIISEKKWDDFNDLEDFDIDVEPMAIEDIQSAHTSGDKPGETIYIAYRVPYDAEGDFGLNEEGLDLLGGLFEEYAYRDIVLYVIYCKKSNASLKYSANVAVMYDRSDDIENAEFYDMDAYTNGKKATKAFISKIKDDESIKELVEKSVESKDYLSAIKNAIVGEEDY